MEFAQILKILWARKLITGAVIAVAVAAAVAVHSSVSSIPTGAATVQLLVDSPDSALANLSQETTPLTERASVLAQVMTSAEVLKEVAAAAKVPLSEITAEGPYSGPGQVLDVITPAEARSNQLLAEHAKYRLTFLAQTDEPVVTASVQGPTAVSAAAVAAAIYPGVESYVTRLQHQSGTPPAHYVTIRQLGPPQAGSVNSSTRSTLTIAAFIGILLLGLLGVLGLEVISRRARENAALESEHEAGYDELTLDTSALTTAHAQPHVRADVGGTAARRR
jgi:capsular polysaccharide biosynthesis protein